MAELKETSVKSSFKANFHLSLLPYGQADDGTVQYIGRTISLDNPVTTAGGLSAIADFRDWLLTSEDAEYPGIYPNLLFQPVDEAVTQSYRAVKCTAEIVKTTTETTPVE